MAESILAELIIGMIKICVETFKWLLYTFRPSVVVFILSAAFLLVLTLAGDTLKGISKNIPLLSGLIEPITHNIAIAALISLVICAVSAIYIFIQWGNYMN